MSKHKHNDAAKHGEDTKAPAAASAVDKDGFPETPEVAALRTAGTEVVAALKKLTEQLRPLSAKLNDDERKSGVGQLIKGEAEQLLKVARYAVQNPELVKGFVGKDGSVDPKVFEGDEMAAHLSMHEVARTIREEVEAETKELLSLLGDLAIHRGLLARPVLLGAYKLFAQLAQSDSGVQGALKSVVEFFDRPSSGQEKDKTAPAPAATKPA